MTEIELWTKASNFIKNDILPFMQNQSDSPEWWIDQSIGHEDPEVLKFVRETVQKCLVTHEGKFQGITTAHHAFELITFELYTSASS
jgi:hypothetical protein